MKTSTLGLTLPVLLWTVSLATVWAGRYPDFDDDAKPLMKAQPELIQYIESHYKVRDTGIAYAPGTTGSSPQPPYFFEAKPLGYQGHYFLTLRVQPGPPGHIVEIIDRPLSSLLPPTESNPSASLAPPADSGSRQSPAGSSSLANPGVRPVAPSSGGASQQDPDASTPTGPMAR